MVSTWSDMGMITDGPHQEIDLRLRVRMEQVHAAQLERAQEMRLRTEQPCGAVAAAQIARAEAHRQGGILMPEETIRRITCSCCEKQIEVPSVIYPILLHMYVEYGWTFYLNEWYCPDCKPEAVKVDFAKHPYYSDYNDQWGCRPKEEWKSHFFMDEPYDCYADVLQPKLCEMCDFMHLGTEDDGSHWMMCCVENPNDHWGHNLYSGHFYGSAIGGRICPYFRCVNWKGRDPIEDKKNGTFHVPYNECYDGD